MFKSTSSMPKNNELKAESHAMCQKSYSQCLDKVKLKLFSSQCCAMITSGTHYIKKMFNSSQLLF